MREHGICGEHCWDATVATVSNISTPVRLLRCILRIDVKWLRPLNTPAKYSEHYWQELCFDKSSLQNFTFACSEISHSIASTLRLWTDWSLKLRHHSHMLQPDARSMAGSVV
jgi:hypothetical protein